MTTIQEKVAAGVKWLDANVEDWRDRVVINDLDMMDGCRCVLGQVFAKRADITGIHSGFNYIVIVRGLDAESLGFDSCGEYENMNISQEFAALQAEWERVLSD